MRHLLILLLLCAACQSGKTGLTYIDKGWSIEASVFKTEENVPIGLRTSIGEVWLPSEWEADYTMRYAFGPYLQFSLPYGFYLEPRVECAYYAKLGTQVEPECGLRLGWRYKSLEIFGGARLPLGNGYRHESFNPPEHEHIPSGLHPEFGITWSFDF